MVSLEEIERLVSKGFYVFPLEPNGKKPLIASFTEQSISTSEKIKAMWTDPVLGIMKPYNVGIATSKYGEGEALLVVDVDTRKQGHNTLNNLEINGKEFPVTWQQKTPTGGLHLIYRVKEPVKQGANVFGQGIDIRSRGGYIVGAGSTIDGKPYELQNGCPLAEAPAWMIEECNRTAVAARKKSVKSRVKIDGNAAIKRVVDYLKRAQPAIEGQAGDEQTYKVASRCKDLGVSEKKCLELMVEHWNYKCRPPWTVDELAGKIENTFAYGQNDPGADAPESDFEEPDDHEHDEEVSTPVEELNEKYSYIIMGGRSTIVKKADNGETIYMNPSTFHDSLKSKKIFVDGKWKYLSDVWMESPKRSTYDVVQLIPERKAPANVYNLWQGFTCTPIGDEEPTEEMIKGVQMFREHMLVNVCNSDEKLFNWLMAYFAHIIQKPWEKPTTALVFKGKKGVGKNALIDRIGQFFEPHYLVASNKRYLSSNFNSHLAQLLLFVLDEAFWSGDKSAEGILKDLVTGNKHLIEQKGKEMYKSNNVTRICIIGNEDWLVPSSVDERRFAVFNVASTRREDTKFFTEMRKCIDIKGGNRLLMQELKNFDLTGYDLNRAPITEGLLEQKIESLPPIYQWWLQSLEDGEIADMDFSEGWPKDISRNRLRDAFTKYTKQRGIRTWLPSAFGKHLKKACPSIKAVRLGARDARYWAYVIPNMEVAREEFSKFIQHPVDWPDAEGETKNYLFS